MDGLGSKGLASRPSAMFEQCHYVNQSSTGVWVAGDLGTLRGHVRAGIAGLHHLGDGAIHRHTVLVTGDFADYADQLFPRLPRFGGARKNLFRTRYDIEWRVVVAATLARFFGLCCRFAMSWIAPIS